MLPLYTTCSNLAYFTLILLLLFLPWLVLMILMDCLHRMVSFGIEDYAKKYGALKPSQFVDLVSLEGDSSDNIPGFILDPYY